MVRRYIKRLEEAARKGNWTFVDERVPRLKNSKPLIDWARKHGIRSPNPDVVDLSMTVLGSANLKRSLSPAVMERTVDSAYRVMTKCKGAPAKYAKYRAALFLARTDVLPRVKREKINRIYGILLEAAEDESVGKLARRSLENIKNFR